jgi:putative ABC transport system permease protein
MNDRPHTVIGVLPPIPQYPNENDVYMTTTSCPFRSAPRSSSTRGSFRGLSLFGRLKPRTTVDVCRADVNVLASRLQKDYPKFYPPASGYHAAVSLLREDLTHDARPLLLVLLGAAAFVLLIACANVANLILARMARREQELVIRTAVGAGSSRLLRQLLTESLLMALLAAALGLGFAVASLPLLAQFAGQLSPRAREISIDGWVLAFAVFCATATTVLFGSVAALYSRHDVASGLKDGARTSAERSRHLLRSTLIAAQVAFSFVLLIGAGLMIRSLVEMQRIKPGFIPQRVVAMNLNTNWSKYKDAASTLALTRRLLEKVQAQPGVLSAALSSDFPMDQTVAANGFSQTFQIEGKVVDGAANNRSLASIRTASTDYFRTLGIPVVSGRAFNDFDKPDSEKVGIVSRSLARHRWSNEDPIGKRISFDNGDTWIKIVGIVGDVREFGPNHDAPEQFYYSVAQFVFARTLLVRTTGDASAIVNQLRRTVHDVEPDIAIVKTKTLEQASSEAVASPRTITSLFGLYAGLALVIAIIGIGSMLALWVRQRTREIGIRMALGASPADILSKLVRQGMVLVVFGLAAGIAGAFALTRLIKTLLFQVEPTDLSTYVAVSVLLTLAALLACYVPARRAARIDPQVALRSE